MHIFKIYVFGLIGLFVFGCGSDPSSSNDIKDIKLEGVFILNEGGFGHGNGSLSFYSAEDKQVQNQVFETVNQATLGDVVQSMTIIDSLGYIVVNNSHTIVIISLNTWRHKQTIDLPAGSSPRYLADGGNGFAYVTNLYTNNVAKIDLSNNTMVKSINVGANPEQIVVHKGKAFVANSGFGSGNTVSVIDLKTDQVTRTIRVGDNPGGLQLDDENELHVLCTGAWGEWGNPEDPGTDGGIYIINTSSYTLVDSLPIIGHPGKFCVSGGVGYFLNNGMVVTYSAETNEVLDESLVSGYFYGLNIDPLSEKLFLLDARDYTQNGDLKIFDLNGQLLETYAVGIAPGSITFNYREER